MMKAVDLFAGWGGFTLGAQDAGYDVVWAANHWQLAVTTHQLNHPTVEHSCQDLRQADWSALPDYDVLLASPACQGHSSASQPRRRPKHDADRATAWAVVDCAEVTEPRMIVVENVLAFRRWKLYGLWQEALATLGYRVQVLTINATRYGVPQRRKRLFIVATLSYRALRVPRLVPEPAFGPLVDWDGGTWRHLHEASPNAQARMRSAQERHGPRCFSQHVTNHPGVGIDEPLRTITTKDQWVAVNGDAYRPLSVREYARGMGFPEWYTWPATATRTEAIRGIGNAVCPPVATGLLRQLAA